MGGIMVKRGLRLLGLVIIILIGLSLTINHHLIKPYRNYFLSESTLYNQPFEAIVVLGAKVEDGEPLPVVKERLDTALFLYEKGVSRRIIVTGKSFYDNQDEVSVMKDYLIENGVPSYRIFIDYGGTTTYRSMFNMGRVFNLKYILVVTQQYHLPRAVYLGHRQGIETFGYPAKELKSTSLYQQVREYFARNKDFVQAVLDPQYPLRQSDINIEWSGDITNKP